jgi:hypothetical protein
VKKAEESLPTVESVEAVLKMVVESVEPVLHAPAHPGGN